MPEWVDLLKHLPQQAEELASYITADKDLADYLTGEYRKLPEELRRGLERNLATRKGTRFFDLLQKNNNPTVRGWALLLAGFLPAELQIPRLFNGLGDKSEENKLVAACKLGKLQSKEVVELLIDGLVTGRWLPARIAQALSAMDASALPQLIKLTTNSDENIRIYAIEILASFVAPEVGPVIMQLLSDPAAKVRKKAAEVVPAFADLICPEQIGQILRSEMDMAVRLQLVRAIGQVNLPGITAILQDEANGDNQKIARAARIALESNNPDGRVANNVADSSAVVFKDCSKF
ncbi:MAG: HEAT repeat domain-containing protein [Peptococcaceae bacterium]|nr:HEAT repeat domain-containing protein [Peptococcaceae bacterium]